MKPLKPLIIRAVALAWAFLAAVVLVCSFTGCQTQPYQTQPYHPNPVPPDYSISGIYLGA